MRLFNISDDRYEDFKFLLHLDIYDKFVKNYVNYMLKLEKPIIVGRLKHHIDFWKSLNSPDWILHNFAWFQSSIFEITSCYLSSQQ